MKDVVHAVVAPVKDALTQLYKVFGDDEIAIFVSITLLFAAVIVYLSMLTLFDALVSALFDGPAATASRFL